VLTPAILFDTPAEVNRRLGVRINTFRFVFGCRFLAANDRLQSAGSGELRGVCQNGEKVISFEICVIGEDALERHPGTQQFQKHFDWIAEPSDTRLSVANPRIDGYSLEQWVHTSSIAVGRSAGQG